MPKTPRIETPKASMGRGFGRVFSSPDDRLGIWGSMIVTAHGRADVKLYVIMT